MRAGRLNAKSADRPAALNELESISDPAAIEALVLVFATEGSSKSSLESNRVLLETVSQIPGPEATAVLLRRALSPKRTIVRAMAADELKKRPMHAYVPQLIAALPARSRRNFT